LNYNFDYFATFFWTILPFNWFGGYLNGSSPFGNIAMTLNGSNLGILKLAQSDLDCALISLDEKQANKFGGKMHWYLTRMIDA
jgi:hypothetical protein